MPDLTHRSLRALLLVTLGVLPARAARAQGTKPLRKAELVRMLATRAIPKADVAALVRRNCVTFQPTAHDRTDLSAAGADEAVLTALDQCLRARLARAAPPPPSAAAPAPAPPLARPSAPPPLRVVASDQMAAPAGTAFDVVAQLFRGTTPQPGVDLVLRGASAMPGGVTRDPAATTDEHGVVTFRILAGLTPATYRLTVVLPDGRSLGPGSQIDFVTSPVSPPTPVARAEPPPAPRPVISEPLTRFTPGAELHGTVGSALGQALVLEVRDTAGAPIAGQRVTIVATGGTVTPGSGESDAAGLVRVRVTLGERAGPTVVTARVGTLTRTATVRADAGPAHALVVERSDTPVTGSLTLRSRDTVALRVVARDEYGNRAALDGFAATTTRGGRAFRLKSTVADSAGVVTLEPRRTGAGELTLSASGLRTRLAVDVVLPGTLVRPWGIGARSEWLGSNHPWIALPGLTGMSGADFGLFGRRTVAGGLSLALGAAAGSLNADRTTGTVSLQLLEGYGRAEWALVPRGAVSPVVSLGAGGYRLKSGDNGQTVFHTNTFWSGGGGVDVVVSPSVIVEVRVERQWLRDTKQGHVATLWPIAAGVRVGL